MAEAVRGYAPRLVQWSSWDEWREVHAGLSSGKPELQHHALKVITAWRFRGRLPMAIEATANLLETLLNDESSESRPQRTDSELCLCYSMAICRFVNGFVDTAQRGVFAAPVHRLAERLSIPLYLVEIRHDVTHGRLPNIEYLRIAAKDALRWLDAHYWLPQSQLLASLSGHHNADVGLIEGLLNVYAGARLRDIERERSKLSADEAARANKRFSRSAERKSISPSVLLHAAKRTADSSREIQRMLKEAESRACVNNYLDVLASALLGQLSSLPSDAFDERDPAFLWQPLLARIEAFHLRLTERLCLRIGNGRTAVQLLAGRWLRWCLTHFNVLSTTRALSSLLNTLLTLPPSRTVRKVSAAILEKLKVEGGAADEAVEYANVALQLDAPGEMLLAEADAKLTLEEMEAKVNELLGTAAGEGNATPLGLLPSGALPDLSLPARIDEGITQEGDPVCIVKLAATYALAPLPQPPVPAAAIDVLRVATPAAASSFEIDIGDDTEQEHPRTNALNPAALLFPIAEILQ